MNLLPEHVAKTLPKIYAQEGKGYNAMAYLKFFDPCSNWTWFVTEFDGRDTFFGLVIGHFVEFGYFSLTELAACKNRLGIGIERDIHFTPKTLEEIMSSQEH